MKETSINWLTHPTGDPFCDIGGMVIEYWQEKRPNKSIMELITEVTNIYVKDWENNLHAFFLNSTITHNSNKGQKGIDKTINYYQGLLNGKEAMEGYCRITGQKGNVFSGGRDNHIMSGSGTLMNFHHGLESGIMLSKEALIRMFFVPLGVELLGDKIAIVISNNEELTRYFVKRNIDNNLRDIASNISKSVQKSDFSNPTNALFDYANQCIENVKSATLDKETGNSNTKGITLNLFHFTNFGAKPTINLFTLPATVFSFYAACIFRSYRKDWLSFTTANYQKFEGSKGLIYDGTTQTYSEKVHEFIAIPNEVIIALQKFDNLKFSLSIAGKTFIGDKKSKSETEYSIFNKNEFEYWKKSKIFKEWKEENRDFDIKNKAIKEDIVLKYEKKDFSMKWVNRIYHKLLIAQSIIPYILKWSKEHPFNFKIVELYQINIQNMDKKALDKIKELADYIVNDRSEDDIKKAMIRLNGAKSSNDLRYFLLKLLGKNYEEGRKDPLFSLDEYVYYLFPDGTYWKEIRDLLLIAIYQKLHEANKKVALELAEIDSEE